MNVLKIQTKVLENLLDSEANKNVRVCINNNTIGVCPDGGACYFIPKKHFYIDCTGVNTFNSSLFFENEYWKSATLAVMDSNDYEITKNGIKFKVIRFSNGNYDIFIDSKYLKYFKKKENICFYIGKSMRSFLYVIENNCMPCMENVVAVIAPIIPSAELLNAVERNDNNK